VYKPSKKLFIPSKNFLSNNSMWEEWIPGDVAKKVKASL